MTWITGLVLIVATLVVLVVWDLARRGGRTCARVVDHVVLFPQIRARRRARAHPAPPGAPRVETVGRRQVAS
jgi:hypothetical protein